MKNLAALLIVTMLTASVSLAKSNDDGSDVKIITVKSHSVYFKVKRAFVGGTVEIYDANQNLLESEGLPHTHTMVFFDNKPSGTYFIKVKKGNKTVEFGYVNL